MTNTTGTQEGTMTETKPRTRKPRTPKDAPPRPTITDAEYAELLAIRLTAMHGFEDGTVGAETKNKARAAIRAARKVRNSPEHAAINATWNAYQERLAAEKEAAKVAKPRKPRAKKTEMTTEVTVADRKDGGITVTVDETGDKPFLEQIQEAVNAA